MFGFVADTSEKIFSQYFLLGASVIFAIIQTNSCLEIGESTL